MAETDVTWLHRLVGFLGAQYLRFVRKTSFVRHRDHPYAQEIRRKRLPAIYAFWHNNQVYLAYDHRREPIHVLVSQSKDGEYIAQVLKWMGVKTARGSTSKGGTQALRLICHVLKKGEQAGFTPDGPKGPLQTVHGGLIAAARLSGCPIVPIAVSPRRKVIFNSWDRFFVPWPFNSISVAHGQPFVISREEPEHDAQQRVRHALNDVVETARREQESMPPLVSSFFGQLIFRIYSILTFVLVPFLIPIFVVIFGWRRSLRSLSERISAPSITPSTRKRLWFHLASYGEWQALKPIYQRLRSLSQIDFLITTNAPEARRLISEQEPDVLVRMCPVDMVGVVTRWVKRVKPDALFLVEKEFWPHLMKTVQDQFIPIFVVNGRFSMRSVHRWKIFRSLVNWLFSIPSCFFVRTKQDQDHFLSMGVSSDKLTVTSNTKYDTLSFFTESEKAEKRASLLGLTTPEHVVIGGSTWEGEEAVLLAIPHKVIIAPRRMARINHVKDLLTSSGKTWTLWSDVKKNHRWTSQILLVDTLGDLKDLYATANVAFVGGSLIPHGGQSPLEPAAAGVAVLFGPSMENFHEESEYLLNENAAIAVRDAKDLLARLDELAMNPSKRKNMGDAAQKAIKTKQGASDMVVKALLGQLGLNHV